MLKGTEWKSKIHINNTLVVYKGHNLPDYH